MRQLFHTAIVLLFFVACAGTKPQDESAKTFILVHGAFQDETSWSAVAEHLVRQGHTVHTPRLPNRGCPANQISPTLLQYATTVGDIAHASKTPVILVGHDFSGIIISRVAELLPKKVAALIYVGAYVPKAGDSFRSLAMSDRDSVLAVRGNFVMSPDYRCASLADKAKTIAFPGVSPDKIIAEPMAPMGEAPDLTAERFGKVPKYYVMTSGDQLLGQKLQERMSSQIPVKARANIEGGHSVNVVKAAELGEILTGLISQ